MANEYKSFYLKDLVDIINDETLEAMLDPLMNYEKRDGTYTLAEISNINSLVAVNNAGVRDLCQRIKRRLREESEKDDS